MSQEELYQFAITQTKLDLELVDIMEMGRKKGYPSENWVAILFMCVDEIKKIMGTTDIDISKRVTETPEQALEMERNLNRMATETKGEAH